jgi:osmotically-inducible protein OsmY
MIRDDTQLQREIIDELNWDPAVKGAEIGVAVRKGVATLSGHVDSYARKYAAERAAERVSGVRALADNVKVKLPMSHSRTDTEIAHAAIAALDWDVEVPDKAITLRVEDGSVFLEGSVEWQYQKLAAERDVRYLMGVRAVANMIKVEPKKASSVDVERRITDALRRGAEKDAAGITVEASDGRVTLRGHVRSWNERADAERAAWGAPGVAVVEDRLVVGK